VNEKRKRESPGNPAGEAEKIYMAERENRHSQTGRRAVREADPERVRTRDSSGEI